MEDKDTNTTREGVARKGTAKERKAGEAREKEGRAKENEERGRLIAMLPVQGVRVGRVRFEWIGVVAGDG